MVNELDTLEKHALALITEAGFTFMHRTGIGGLVVDIAILANNPNSGPVTIGIITRNWDAADSTAAERAAREAKLVESQVASSSLWILVPGPGTAVAPLLTLGDLRHLLEGLSPARKTRGLVQIDLGPARPVAFCAMPFHEDFLDVYLLAIVPAFNQLGYDVNRLDQSHSFVGIDRRIREGIESARLVIADISERNPNVMYEIGLAHGLGRNTFLLGNAETEIPFDIRDQMVLRYNRKRIHELSGELQIRVAQAMKE